MYEYEKYVNDFKTGDIILFNENHFWSSPLGPFSWLIKYFTKSSWSHIGMIVKDPEFTEKELPAGLYLWESSLESCDAEDHRMKLGVQLVPLKEKLDSFNGIIHWRKLNYGHVYISNTKLREIHELVHNKPYDLNPADWIEAWIEHKSTPNNHRYFCSALVARIYSYLGFVDPDIDWSIIRPSSFSVENPDDPTHIVMLNESKLEPEVEIKNT